MAPVLIRRAGGGAISTPGRESSIAAEADAALVAMVQMVSENRVRQCLQAQRSAKCQNCQSACDLQLEGNSLCLSMPHQADFKKVSCLFS